MQLYFFFNSVNVEVDWIKVKFKKFDWKWHSKFDLKQFPTEKHFCIHSKLSFSKKIDDDVFFSVKRSNSAKSQLKKLSCFSDRFLITRKLFCSIGFSMIFILLLFFAFQVSTTILTLSNSENHWFVKLRYKTKSYRLSYFISCFPVFFLQIKSNQIRS